MKDLKILFVEDSSEDAELAAAELEKNGYRLTRCDRVQTREDLLTAIRSGAWDLVIGDFSMPSFNGLEALGLVREAEPDLPYIMVSGTMGEAQAVNAMKAGASDYLMKGNLQRLGPAVEREIRDVADRKRSQDALRKSEEQLRLAQRMETVGRLAGGVAHDFNNILSVVSGYANLLQMKMGRTGDVPHELMEIERAVVKATALVRQLLSFSRKQVVQPQILDLANVIKDSLSMLRMVVGEDIQLEIKADPGLGRIRADKSQIEQIIMNLAVNAKDAISREGVFGISLSAEDPDAPAGPADENRGAAGSILLKIWDNGEGIPEDVLPRIFEPFFTTKVEGRGTGLGLSTVFSIVQQNAGEIRVETRVGAGTAFTIRFPRISDAEAETAGPIARTGRHPVSRGETILLVEDDVALRKLAKDVLVLEGYRVLEPATPQDALGFAGAAELKIDLLLTDLVMPRMNGKELSEAVLAKRPDLRVVFMSGYAPEFLMPEAGLIPESCFLEKPFTPAQLLCKVRGALDAGRVEKHL